MGWTAAGAADTVRGAYVFLPDTAWVVIKSGLQGWDFERTVLHEFGHAAGILGDDVEFYASLCLKPEDDDDEEETGNPPTETTTTTTTCEMVTVRTTNWVWVEEEREEEEDDGNSSCNLGGSGSAGNPYGCHEIVVRPPSGEWVQVIVEEERMVCTTS